MELTADYGRIADPVPAELDGRTFYVLDLNALDEAGYNAEVAAIAARSADQRNVLILAARVRWRVGNAAGERVFQDITAEQLAERYGHEYLYRLAKCVREALSGGQDPTVEDAEKESSGDPA